STDARGFYHVVGSRADAEQMRQLLIDRGFTVEKLQYFKVREAYSFCFDSDAIGLGFAVMLCAVMLLTASGVILSAKKYAIARLHGTARAAQLFTDIRYLSVFGAACLAVVATVVAVFLAATSGTAQLRHYLTVSAFLWLIFFGVSVLAYLLALTLVQLMPLLGAIKGELSGRAILLVSYLGKTLALVVALSVLGSVYTSQRELSENHVSQETWQKTAGQVSFELSSSIGYAEMEKMAEPIGSWLIAENRAGRIIFCQRISGNEVLPVDPKSPFAQSSPSDSMLLVNSTYLKLHPILDSAGQPIVADTKKVRVYFPGKLISGESKLRAGLERHFSTPRSSKVKKYTPPVIEFGQHADQQAIFSYNSEIGGQQQSSFMEHGVVIVLPTERDLIPPGDYYSYATSSSVIATSEEAALAGINRNGFTKYFGAVMPVKRVADDRYREALRTASLAWMNGLLALIMLVATTMSFGIVYSRRESQRIFARFVHGWPFLRTHLTVLLIDLGVTLALLLAALGPGQESDGPPMLEPPSVWLDRLPILLALAAVTLTLLTLHRVTSTMCKKHTTALA
ncbi:MAG: hypothetical protein ACRC0L_06405, partial [Angustibacter sp.]